MLNQIDQSLPATTVFHVTGIDKSRDGMASQELQVGQFFIGLVIGIAKEQREPVLMGDIFDTANEFRKIGISNAWNDDPDREALTCA